MSHIQGSNNTLKSLPDSALSKLIVMVSLAAASFGWLLNFIGLCVGQSTQIGGGFNIFGLNWYFMFLYFVWLIIGALHVVTRETAEQPFKNLANGFTLLVLAGAPLDIGDSLSKVSVDIGSTGNQLKTTGTIILVVAAFIIFINFNTSIEHLKGVLGHIQSAKPKKAPKTVVQKEQAQYAPRDADIEQATVPVAAQYEAPNVVNAPVAKSEVSRAPENAPAEVFLAQALYNYDANPADAKEISFKAGEVFEVLDSRGKWWKVKGTTNSSVGIAPSNFLKVLTQ
jgi:hypothetical protein